MQPDPTVLEARRFPMLNGPRSIEWAVAEKIYVVYAALYGRSQSLERLAERGGFGWVEVGLLWRDAEKKFGREWFKRHVGEAPHGPA